MVNFFFKKKALRLLIKVKLHNLLTGGAALAEAGGQKGGCGRTDTGSPPTQGNLR